jgi:hypothetical protein
MGDSHFESDPIGLYSIQGGRRYYNRKFLNGR